MNLPKQTPSLGLYPKLAHPQKNPNQNSRTPRTPPALKMGFHTSPNPVLIFVLGREVKPNNPMVFFITLPTPNPPPPRRSARAFGSKPNRGAPQAPRRCCPRPRCTRRWPEAVGSPWSSLNPWREWSQKRRVFLALSFGQLMTLGPFKRQPKSRDLFGVKPTWSKSKSDSSQGPGELDQCSLKPTKTVTQKVTKVRIGTQEVR